MEFIASPGIFSPPEPWQEQGGWRLPNRTLPAVSQQGLTLNGAPFNNGCVPTAVGGVTNYWHTVDPTYQALEPQWLIDHNAGLFTGAGLSASHMIDDLDKAGYRAVPHLNSDYTSLRRDTAWGPVVAYVHQGMQPTGVAHVVIVSRATNDFVEAADPWTGTVDRYPTQQFLASWDTDFGGGKRRNYLAIQPAEPERVQPEPRVVAASVHQPKAAASPPPWRGRMKKR
jgi:hypothetical protein